MAQLFDEHGSVAYSLALAIVADENVAERVVADAFADIWHQTQSALSSRVDVRTLLLTAVRKEALRSRPHDAKLPDCDALGGLPASQRRVLELAYFAGLSLSRIAAELQEPLSEVKANMRLALQHMREHSRKRFRPDGAQEVTPA
ncbi:MAG: sigma factor-like helix-turn-helix DNA-binding protein [Gemmatimonadaceae bacterium]